MSKGAFAFVRSFATSLAVAQTSKPKTSPRLPPAPAVSAPQPQKEQVVEVTEQDFTALPKIVSTSLSTFGVRLGMNEDEAIAALKSYPQIATGPNEYHRNALRIFVKAGPLVCFMSGTLLEVQYLGCSSESEDGAWSDAWGKLKIAEDQRRSARILIVIGLVLFALALAAIWEEHQ